MTRVLDRLDTPAQVVSDLGQTLIQNPLAVALLGDQTHFTGPSRSIVYRYFTDPAEREIYPPEDREHHGRAFVAALRVAVARDAHDGEAIELVERLRSQSEEFASLWNEHEIGTDARGERKRLVHPTIGTIELDCQVMVAENEAQMLLV